MKLRRLEEQVVRGQRVLIRADLNVPITAGNVTNDARIRASVPSIRHCIDHGAHVIVASHLGRPRAGHPDASLSLNPVAKILGELIGVDVMLAADWKSGLETQAGKVHLLENVRFEEGEEANDPEFARMLASLCDVFVMDAFGTAHRAHASTAGITQHVDHAVAGLLLAAEVDALSKIIDNPERPLLAVIGGAKVSTKLEVLKRLAQIADSIIVGGGMANTFLLEEGRQIGSSLAEPDMLGAVGDIRELTEVAPIVDVMVAPTIEPEASATVRLVDEVESGECIVDLGPETARRLAGAIGQARTIVWNGPMGVFEHPQFGEGTRVIGTAIADSSGLSVAGGGDTLAALDRFGLTERIGYVSTGGGAFLEFMEGRELPGIAPLMQ